jgi:hypothetical protein
MPCCLMSTGPSTRLQPRALHWRGEKSLAVRLTLGSDDRTLTDEQIEAAVQAVVAQLATWGAPAR